MRTMHVVSLLSLVVVGGCVRKVADYPVPANATRAPSGVWSVTIKAGTGDTATSGELYGVNWTLLSHTKRGCKFPCEERELLSRSELKDARWREIVMSMRKGETRRVWIVEKANQEAHVYDVTLASVDRLGADGQAIVDPRAP